MKKSELNFKCFTGTKDRNKTLIDSLNKAGFKIAGSTAELDAEAVEVDSGVYSYWEQIKSLHPENEHSFEKSTANELSLPDALKLIASIKPDAPEFDIKLRDEVLCRDDDGDEWGLCLFSHISKNPCLYAIRLVGGVGYEKIIKYKGNESFLGATNAPAGWWECENGKTIWKTR